MDELDEGEDDELEQEMLRDLENGDLDFEGIDEADDDDEEDEDESESDEDEDGDAGADGKDSVEEEVAVKTRPVPAANAGDEEDEENWLGIGEKSDGEESQADDESEANKAGEAAKDLTGQYRVPCLSRKNGPTDRLGSPRTAPHGFAALADVDGDMADGASSDEDEEDVAGQTDADKANAAAVKAFFTAHKNTASTSRSKPLSFSTLPNCTLSRPLLLALGSLNLATPTPIQAECIPLAMMGKDIVASSATGSGKTVAFWVGVLERLLHRDRRNPMTRVVVMTPTRELAVQVHGVGMALARYTDVSFCLCVGASCPSPRTIIAGSTLRATAHFCALLPAQAVSPSRCRKPS